MYEDSRYPYALTGIIDESGVRYATWTYGSGSQAISSAHAGGVDTTTLSFNSDGSVVTVTGPLGRQVSYTTSTVQKAPKVTATSEAADSTCPAMQSSVAYDSNGYLSQSTDRNGNVTTFTFDASGEMTSRVVASGTSVARTTTMSWNTAFGVPSQIVAPGKTTDFTFVTGTGLVATRTETDTSTGASGSCAGGARCRTWTYTYTNASNSPGIPVGLLLSVTGPRTDGSGPQTTSFTYDASGNLLTATDPLGHSYHITAYSAEGLPLTIVDPNGVSTALAYDARDRLVSQTIHDTVNGDAVTSFTWNGVSKLTKVTRPDGSTYSYQYDSARRLTRVTDAVGNYVAFTLDAAGNRTRTDIALASAGSPSLTNTATYDTKSRQLRAIGSVAAGEVTALAYDNNDNLTSLTDPLQRTTSLAYDALDRLSQALDPLQATIAVGYDTIGRVSAVTDPLNHQTSYTNDGFEGTTKIVSPDTGTQTATFDLASNPTQRTDARGVVESRTYDLLDRLTAVTYAGRPSESLAYRYDESGSTYGVGHLTSLSDPAGSTVFNYDQHGRLVSETRTAATAPSQPYVTQYTYDPANRLKTITYPSGRIVTMVRDAAGRVVTVAARPNAAGSDVTLASSITYTPFGAIAGLTFGNGVVLTRGFDTDGRLSSQTAVTSTGGAIQNLGYRYDLAGRIAAISDSVGTGSTAGWTTGASSYVRTAANNQLASIAQGGSTVRQFAYDAAGNVLTDTRTGNAGTFTYNGAGQLVAYGRNASAVAAYTFDGLGRRAEASVITGGATAITRTIYSGGTRLAINDASGWVDLIDLGDIPLAVFDHGTLSYVHADQLGTPLKATDSTGAVVKNLLLAPFGATITSTGSAADPRRFPGQVLDAETGLHQNFARSYDPTVGRYMSPDPIGLNGGISLYPYAGGNPVNQTDPTGQFIFLVAAGPAAYTAAMMAADALIVGGVGYYLSDQYGNTRSGKISRPSILCSEDNQDDNVKTGENGGNQSKTLPRPAGIPDNWIEKPTDKNDGIEYINPDNSNDRVRVMPGNLDSSFSHQQGPYVIDQRGGYRDVDGNPILAPKPRQTPEAHIPYDEFKFRR